jgi:hypothetical protein
MNHFTFHPEHYGSHVAELLRDNRLPELGPGQSNRPVEKLLRSLTAQQLFGSQKISDGSMAECCLSGLWLWHDFLDESHTLSQQIETTAGSYWHGIMHRREPDYFNAKYWFQRVGEHPIFPTLAQEAAALAQAEQLDAPARFLQHGSRWQAANFVDLCAAIAQRQSRCELLARRIAAVEWQLLFDFCWQRALGK